ncbi:MAG: MerR family transcriptional regulator [Acidobacteria bacterium]|nr:MerR family transcriptional regulator [Acidobacteriota bacterium]
MRLKKNYSSREVAALTGLTARQLQWWNAHAIFSPAIGTRPTAAGGFTERRYSLVELLELLVLANLRRRGFTAQNIRLLLDTLRTRFGIRLYDAIQGGSIRLLTDNRDVFARTEAGQLFSLIRFAGQPMLVLGDDDLKELNARPHSPRKKTAAARRVKKGAAGGSS